MGEIAETLVSFCCTRRPSSRFLDSGIGDMVDGHAVVDSQAQQLRQDITSISISISISTIAVVVVATPSALSRPSEYEGHDFLCKLTKRTSREPIRVSLGFFTRGGCCSGGSPRLQAKDPTCDTHNLAHARRGVEPSWLESLSSGIRGLRVYEGAGWGGGQKHYSASTTAADREKQFHFVIVLPSPTWLYDGEAGRNNLGGGEGGVLRTDGRMYGGFEGRWRAGGNKEGWVDSQAERGLWLMQSCKRGWVEYRDVAPRSGVPLCPQRRNELDAARGPTETANTADVCDVDVAGPQGRVGLLRHHIKQLLEAPLLVLWGPLTWLQAAALCP